MKLFKYLLWLIVICLLVTLVLQNKDYFAAATVLHLDLKVMEDWKWSIPELATGYYFAICFGLGLLLTGFKALVISFRLGREIKTKDKQIIDLKDEVNLLKTELEVFKHDPYIKKSLEASDSAPALTEGVVEAANESDEPDTQEKQI